MSSLFSLANRHGTRGLRTMSFLFSADGSGNLYVNGAGEKKHGKGKITAYNENILRVQGEGMD